MTSTRLLPAILLASLVVAGCGDRAQDRPDLSDPPPTSTVHVEPVQVDGGSFIEGFVAGTDIDGEAGAISRMAPLADTVTATVRPGSRDVRVLVYPCDGSCAGGWSAFAQRYEAELQETGGDGRLGDFVTECRDVIDVAPGADLTLTPTIDLSDVGDAGPTCELERE